MDRTLEIWIVFGGIMLAVIGFFYVVLFVMKRQKERGVIQSIKQGQGVFATWHYSPEEWKRVAEEHFEIKPRRLGENGKASFTERFVLVTNGTEDILFELIGEQRYVRHLTDVYIYKQTERSVIRFEVRTKNIKKDENGRDTMEEEYETETFYTPVPKGAEADGEKVLQFYKNLLDKNADAVAAVMPFGLGIFKR